MAKQLWGVWCKDAREHKGDWLREHTHSVADFGGIAVLAFEDKRDAAERAAKAYGFDSYAKAKRAGWVEVRALPFNAPETEKP